MSKEFILVDTFIIHDAPKPAKHLLEGEHILFGGKVWIVKNAGFNDQANFPNDLIIDLYTFSNKIVQEQTITVDRDFEVQPLMMHISPAKAESPSEPQTK